MDTPFKSKAEARKHFFALRSSIKESVRKEKSLSICQKISDLPNFLECDALFIYAPIKFEADPLPLFEVNIEKIVRNLKFLKQDYL